jgi:peroxiredoxin
MKINDFVLGLMILGFAGAIAQGASVGEKAPDFTGKDTRGKIQKLSDHKGKYVVLEWHNHDCPFTQSQYQGKMQKLQQTWTKKGIVWLRIISSAPGKDGYVTAARANLDAKRNGTTGIVTILDPTGEIGQAYGAKTTPHMFIISPAEILLYEGAVDNAPLEDNFSDKTQKGEQYINYVEQALMQTTNGQEISIKTTAPYGCSIKYKTREKVIN